MHFFTADTHFGHESIIRLCRRPFASVEAMDAAMVEHWNQVVGPDDTVFHLGDFAWKGRGAEALLARLAGKKVLIVGNHDGEAVRRLAGWSGVHEYLETALDPARHLVLFHYPMREWNHYFRGAVHFFGHVHNAANIAPIRNSHNVGVDLWDFRPRRYEEIVAPAT